MNAQTILLLAIAALLCVALVLVLMQPRKPRPDHGKLTIDLECDAEPAMAELRKVTAVLEKIARLQERTLPAMRLEVKDSGREPSMVRPNQHPAKHRTPEKPKRR